MIESSLSKLEQLVSDLVQQKQELLDANEQLNTELAQARDENESLQLTLMEQEEKQGATAARIQALALAALRDGGKRGQRPALWDGHAAERIVQTLVELLA